MMGAYVAYWLDDGFADRKDRWWVTETGVSSEKVSDYGQYMFWQHLSQDIMTKQPQWEGLLGWPLNDADPQQNDFVPPEGKRSHFYKFGVVGYDNNTYKGGGNAIANVWPTWP